jgi:hypothetical protein
MKRFVIAILFLVVAIAVLMGFYRKRTPGVKTSVSEVEDPGTQITHEVPPVVEEADKSSKPFSENGTALMPVDSNERILARRRNDLSPRLISVITNQLSRLGPLEEEKYDKEDWHELMLAKTDYVAGWAKALFRFAEKNGGMCPETLDQAAQFYPDEYAWLLSVFDKDRFEVVYRGSLDDLRDPANVILVRERVPTVIFRSLQHWQKSYIYGDGLTGMMYGFNSIDEFQAYESPHLANSDGG